MGDVVRYLCGAQIGGRRRIFIWQADADGRDQVAVDESGAVLSFASEAEARQEAAGGARISDDPVVWYDLDGISSWCHSTDVTVDCSTLLNVWNLFTDVPHEEDLFLAADARADDIYDKLFHGCNLPAMGASPGDDVPAWTAEEIAILKRLLLLGINDFRSRCRSWPADPDR